MPNPIQARGVLVVIYSIINNDAKPTIAALPLNRSAKRLKPNLVTTNLGWTVGCMFAMTKNITYYWAMQYLFYGCLTRSASVFHQPMMVVLFTASALLIRYFNCGNL